jgi:glutathione S-transferase
MSFIAATLHPARRRGIARARTVYAVADRRLGMRTWAIGDYSIADIHLFRLTGASSTRYTRHRASFPISTATTIA